MTADPQRWQEVEGHMANALPPQADLLRKKLRTLAWEDTKLLVAGTGHYPPTKGMSVEGQKTMIMVAIHVATARLQGKDRVFLGERRSRGADRRSSSKKKQRPKKNAWTHMRHEESSPRPKPPSPGARWRPTAWGSLAEATRASEAAR